eukprot:762769-Hanusia_phi.AAC.5
MFRKRSPTSAAGLEECALLVLVLPVSDFRPVALTASSCRLEKNPQISVSHTLHSRAASTPQDHLLTSPHGFRAADGVLGPLLCREARSDRSFPAAAVRYSLVLLLVPRIEAEPEKSCEEEAEEGKEGRRAEVLILGRGKGREREEGEVEVFAEEESRRESVSITFRRSRQR